MGWTWGRAQRGGGICSARDGYARRGQDRGGGAGDGLIFEKTEIGLHRRLRTTLRRGLCKRLEPRWAQRCWCSKEKRKLRDAAGARRIDSLKLRGSVGWHVGATQCSYVRGSRAIQYDSRSGGFLLDACHERRQHSYTPYGDTLPRRAGLRLHRRSIANSIGMRGFVRWCLESQHES
jgi:hypothetical protein